MFVISPHEDDISLNVEYISEFYSLKINSGHSGSIFDNFLDERPMCLQTGRMTVSNISSMSTFKDRSSAGKKHFVLQTAYYQANGRESHLGDSREARWHYVITNSIVLLKQGIMAGT